MSTTKQKLFLVCIVSAIGFGIYKNEQSAKYYTSGAGGETSVPAAVSNQMTPDNVPPIKPPSAPSNATAIADFLADQDEMKSGTKTVIGPGRMGCLGGSICGLYDTENTMVYAMVDISKLNHDNKVQFLTSNALSGPPVYLEIKHIKSDVLDTNYVLRIIQ